MLIPSLHIAGFRTFREISIEQLGDVNLITGRNNAGKTALLEAVHLLAARGSPAALAELLQQHDEIDRRAREEVERTVRREVALDVRGLFYGRPLDISDQTAFAIAGGAESLRVSWRLEPLERGRLGAPALVIDAASVTGDMVCSLESQGGWIWRRIVGLELPPFVPARGMSAPRLASWWDEVSLTDAENRVLECLQIAAPIEKIAFVESPPWGRFCMVRLTGEREPVPLRSLGDGLTRMFSFALAVERARQSGVLLVDEIENGVHYTILPDLWRFIFATARANGVQVFATTHSWDCIAAFAEVAAEDRESVGALVRLRDRHGVVVPTVFTEDDLRVIERDQIEVR